MRLWTTPWGWRHLSLSARISLGFIGMLAAVLVIQAALIAWAMNRREASGDSRRAARLAYTGAIAATLATELRRDPRLDLEGFVDRYPYGIALIMRDGRTVGADWSEIDKRGAVARMNEGRNDIPEAWRVGDFAASPITIDGTLQGAVASLPPPLWREVGPWMAATIIMLVLGGSVTLSLVVMRPVRRRITALQEAARRLGDGDLTARAPVVGADEITQLSRTFNVMADDLSARASALETSDRLRRQLIADVSHELMTPLTAVTGRLETMLMPEVRLSPQQRERNLTVAMREARRIERLIGDLLDAARLEGGGGHLSPELFPVADLFSDIQTRHERAVQARHIRLETRVVPEDLAIMADPFRLEQALENLVVNALRHTPHGGSVRLTARREGGEVVLTVSDSGEGIPPEHLPFVFDRFYKATSADGTASPGSGLGLSIVKAIVTRHGGRVSAESTPGQGTTISVTLPVPRSSVSTPPVAQSA